MRRLTRSGELSCSDYAAKNSWILHEVSWNLQGYRSDNSVLAIAPVLNAADEVYEVAV